MPTVKMIPARTIRMVTEPSIRVILMTTAMAFPTNAILTPLAARTAMPMVKMIHARRTPITTA